VRNLLGEKLPPSWHPFPNGEVEVILKDRLKYCEDVLFDHDNGLAIVSGDPGRGEWNTVMVSLVVNSLSNWN
jgi:arylesterase / paraoxonase